MILLNVTVGDFTLSDILTIIGTVCVLIGYFVHFNGRIVKLESEVGPDYIEKLKEIAISNKARIGVVEGSFATVQNSVLRIENKQDADTKILADAINKLNTTVAKLEQVIELLLEDRKESNRGKREDLMRREQILDRYENHIKNSDNES